MKSACQSWFSLCSLDSVFSVVGGVSSTDPQFHFDALPSFVRYFYFCISDFDQSIHFRELLEYSPRLRYDGVDVVRLFRFYVLIVSRLCRTSVVSLVAPSFRTHASNESVLYLSVADFGVPLLFRQLSLTCFVLVASEVLCIVILLFRWLSSNGYDFSVSPRAFAAGPAPLLVEQHEQAPFFATRRSVLYPLLHSEWSPSSYC